jgi:hypothetical protein
MLIGACIAQGIINAGVGPLSYELAAEIAYPVGYVAYYYDDILTSL